MVALITKMYIINALTQIHVCSDSPLIESFELEYFIAPCMWNVMEPISSLHVMS